MRNDRPINHPKRQTLNPRGRPRRARIPEYAERLALQELEEGLREHGEQHDDHGGVDEVGPAAGGAQAEKKQGDGAFDERDGPVEDYLEDEEEAEGAQAVGGRDEAGAQAEAVGAGDALDCVVYDGEELWGVVSIHRMAGWRVQGTYSSAQDGPVICFEDPASRPYPRAEQQNGDDEEAAIEAQEEWCLTVVACCDGGELSAFHHRVKADNKTSSI